ncbi:MAG: response regulator transcription factor [Campylobacterales bacterium]
MFNRKVLLVEDQGTARDELAQILNRKFKIVLSASDGQEGYEIYKKELPDLVITDIQMPKLNGVEFSKLIKDLNPSQYILAISAYSDSGYLIDMINIGINRFITKPINPKQLLDILITEAQNLDNKEMLAHYQQELESKNRILEDKNRELERSLKIFENKMLQISHIKNSTKKPTTIDDDSRKIKEKADNEKERDSLKYFIESHSLEMEELESEMESMIIRMDLKKTIEESMFKQISRYFNTYASMIGIHADYGLGLLSEKMHELSNKMNEVATSSIDKENSTIIINSLESITYTLKHWREKIFANMLSQTQSEYYDDSMICDINTIFLGLENRANDLDDEMELF